MQQNKDILLKAVAENKRRIDIQKGFLREYFNTPVHAREALFGKYSDSGGPAKH